MLSTVTEKVEEDIGSSIHHFRMLCEADRRIDVPAKSDDCHHTIHVARTGNVELRQDVERYLA